MYKLAGALIVVVFVVATVTSFYYAFKIFDYSSPTTEEILISDQFIESVRSHE